MRNPRIDDDYRIDDSQYIIIDGCNITYTIKSYLFDGIMKIEKLPYHDSRVNTPYKFIIILINVVLFPTINLKMNNVTFDKT